MCDQKHEWIKVHYLVIDTPKMKLHFKLLNEFTGGESIWYLMSCGMKWLVAKLRFITWKYLVKSVNFYVACNM